MAAPAAEQETMAAPAAEQETMTTPQDPPVRNKQKRRRAKKLAEWRTKHPAPAKQPAAKSGK